MKSLLKSGSSHWKSQSCNAFSTEALHKSPFKLLSISRRTNDFYICFREANVTIETPYLSFTDSVLSLDHLAEVSGRDTLIRSEQKTCLVITQPMKRFCSLRHAAKRFLIGFASTADTCKVAVELSKLTRGKPKHISISILFPSMHKVRVR